MNTRDTGEDIWEPVRDRQTAMAKWIGEELCGCKVRPLKPLFSAFHVPSDLSFHDLAHLWSDERVCDMAWWPVARALGPGALDHPWAFGAGDGPKEPWGFVAEPYWTVKQARAATARAELATKGWGVGFVVLPLARSAWNPGHCVPIIAFCPEGRYPEFISHAMRWLFTKKADRFEVGPSRECDE